MRLFRPLLLLPFLLLLSACSSRQVPEDILLTKGKLELSWEDMERSSLFKVRGNAGFYWGQFIDPSQPPPMTEYTEVSEDWGGVYPEQGDASIRVIIEKDPLIDEIALSFTSVWCSYRMYINGDLVAEAGNPALDPGRRQLYLHRKDVITYTGSSDTLDIVYHISNPYYHRNGVKQLKIGTDKAIRDDFFWDLFSDCLILGILLAMTAYHFIMAASKTNRTYIMFFALLTLTITYRYFTVSSRLVFDVFPNLSMISYDRLQRLGIYPIAGFFISYLYHLYPHIGRKSLVRIIQIASLVFSVLSFFVSPKMVSGALFTAFYPVFILTVLYGIYVIAIAMIKREEDAFPMAAGIMLLVGTAVFDMVLDRDLLPSHFVYQMDKGMIGFIFVQAYIITLRINRAYENEKRFREALQGVQSRLELTVEGGQLGLIEWDIVHNTWFLNDIFAEMIGFRKDHHIFSRRHWLDLVHPDDLKEIDTLLKGALSGKIGNFRKEYRIRMHGGSYRWCLLLGKVIQQNRLGGAEWFVGLHIDVSDKKRNEEALSQIIEADKSGLEEARDKAEQLLRGELNQDS